MKKDKNKIKIGTLDVCMDYVRPYIYEKMKK